MKPSDLYAMPTITAVAWPEASEELLREAFGLEPRDVNLDHASEFCNPRTEFQLKMSARIGDFREGAVHALVFDGRPFGILATAGGEARFTVTDVSRYNDAICEIEAWRHLPRFGTVADHSEELYDLDVFGGMAVVETPEGFRLVDRRVSDGSGTLVLDETRLEAALRSHARNLVVAGDTGAAARAAASLGGFDGVDASSPSRVRLSDADARRSIAEVIRQGVPEELRAIVVDEIPRETTLDDDFDLNGCEFDHDWTAVVVETEEGTYALSVPVTDLLDGSFGWSKSVRSRRLGPPELFDEYAFATDSPTP